MSVEPIRSTCPHCGARGVKRDEPLINDGVNVDRPYCGKCGRNYPREGEQPSNIRPFKPSTPQLVGRW